MTHAVQFRNPGGYDVLEWVEIDDPSAGPGQIVIDVHAAGVNFIDTYHRSGLYTVPLPFTPGSEGSGTVVEVADDVGDFAVGDRVAWVGQPGSYTTRLSIPAAAALRVPDEMSLDVAAATPLQGMTAHYLVTSTHPLAPGHRCLIHAAAGGTGRLMVQMAKIRGAEVVATAGSDEKAELARSAGADHVINYTTTDLVEGVEAAVGRDAIDVVYDGVGAATFDAGLALLKPRGTMVTFGNASGPVPAVTPLTLMPKSLFLTRPKLGDYIVTTEARDERWNEIAGWVRDGRLEVRVGHTFPLAAAGDAHRALESRATTGKILLTA
jgi:NADPH2:quinone reductase